VLKIVLAEEADEDAVLAVVSGNAGNHGDIDAWLPAAVGCGLVIIVAASRRDRLTGCGCGANGISRIAGWPGLSGFGAGHGGNGGGRRGSDRRGSG